MRTGRPKLHQVTLSESQREQLEAFSRSRSLPHGLSRRAAVVLHAGEGMPNTMIAARLGMTETTVRKWCKRFIDEGIDGL
ncbi:MAG: helix-turn-helix domain-containing protein, partial [Gammaproteobacteria bacterium]|nr:helix-turn-helix domain-containing protein [Gammaproteobacteria bacterium]